MLTDGLWMALMVTESWFESTALGLTSPWKVKPPWAVAWLVTKPPSRSACVTVWLAVQVAEAVGARVVTSHDGVASVLSSLTLTELIVTLPVLVTTYW